MTRDRRRVLPGHRDQLDITTFVLQAAGEALKAGKTAADGAVNTLGEVRRGCCTVGHHRISIDTPCIFPHAEKWTPGRECAATESSLAM